MIDSKVAGGAYHYVIIDGQVFSKHTTDYKASEKAYDVALAFLDKLNQGIITVFPQVAVIFNRTITFTVDPGFDPTSIPTPTEDPVADNGMDLIDWWNSVIDPIDPTNVLPVVPQNMDQATILRDALIRGLAEETKSTWRPRRAVDMDANGNYFTIAVCWRGYKLVFDQRDKNAIRIGGS